MPMAFNGQLLDNYWASSSPSTNSTSPEYAGGSPIVENVPSEYAGCRCGYATEDME